MKKQTKKQLGIDWRKAEDDRICWTCGERTVYYRLWKFSYSDEYLNVQQKCTSCKRNWLTEERIKPDRLHKLYEWNKPINKEHQS